MWNEMGNSNTSLKEEGDASAKSPKDDAPEEAEAVLHLAEEVETTDVAKDESPREDMKCEIRQTMAEEPVDPPAEAKELASDSKGERGLMDSRNGSELVDTRTLPEIVEEPNGREREDGWKGKRSTPSVCTNLEDAVLSPDTNTKSTASESEPAEEGMEKSTEILSNHTETSLGDIRELLGPAEHKVGGSSASDELGLAEGKESAIASTLPSSANKDNSPEETDTLVEEGISSVEDIWEDDTNLWKEENTTAEMKLLEMAEPGDPVQYGGECAESEENSRRSTFSSLDSDNAILDCDRLVLLQPDDTRVEDESVVFVKPTGILSTTDVREVGGHFECKADQSPSEEVPASVLKNADAHIKIEGDLEGLVDEGGAFMAVKAPELGIVEEGFPTPREECFVGLTRDTVTLAESKKVIGRLSEAEKPTEDTNSDMKRDARFSNEDVQAFEPLKLNPPSLTPLPINEEASKVGSDGGGGLSREDKKVLDSRSHGSKPDKAVNLRMKKSPSFDFDLRITRTEESDRTPLLFQDKRVVRTATSMTAGHGGNTEQKKPPIAKERVPSFGPADLRTPSLGFSREEHESSGFHNHGILEKQEKVLLLAQAKELKVIDGPTSPEHKGKRRPRSSLFGNCMCCATVIN